MHSSVLVHLDSPLIAETITPLYSEEQQGLEFKVMEQKRPVLFSQCLKSLFLGWVSSGERKVDAIPSFLFHISKSSSP